MTLPVSDEPDPLAYGCPTCNAAPGIGCPLGVTHRTRYVIARVHRLREAERASQHDINRRGIEACRAALGGTP